VEFLPIGGYAMSAVMKPKMVSVRRKKIELQIEREQLSYHLQKGWHLEVRNDKNDMVEATPEQIDEMLSP
jgi:hypothetical protein